MFIFYVIKFKLLLQFEGKDQDQVELDKRRLVVLQVLLVKQLLRHFVHNVFHMFVGH